MGYNQDLEARIDRMKAISGSLDKKKMFGGIGYLLHGNMCFGIHKQSLVLRISPGKAAELLKREYVTPFNMTGKPMNGWVLVSPDALQTDEQLKNMLMLGKSFAETLPGK